MMFDTQCGVKFVNMFQNALRFWTAACAAVRKSVWTWGMYSSVCQTDIIPHRMPCLMSHVLYMCALRAAGG